MDELLELGFDFIGEGIVAWLLRIVGVLLLIGAVAAFLVYEMPLVAAGLAVTGVLLIVAPSVIAAIAEIALELG